MGLNYVKLNIQRSAYKQIQLIVDLIIWKCELMVIDQLNMYKCLLNR